MHHRLGANHLGWGSHRGDRESVQPWKFGFGKMTEPTTRGRFHLFVVPPHREGVIRKRWRYLTCMLQDHAAVVKLRKRVHKERRSLRNNGKINGEKNVAD